MALSRCTKCQAEILWAVNPKTGRRMPMDAHPVGGTYTVSVEGGRTVARYVETYRSHFATCPDADSFRSGR